MSFKEDLMKIASQITGNLKEARGVFSIEATIAERKAFLSVKKLIYTAKIKIDEKNLEIHFQEMLKESGAGLSSGIDSDFSSGFGFKKEVYKTTASGREGSIEESSKLFGKDYTYKFDYPIVRKQVEALAINSGYKFTYHIVPGF